MMALIVGLLLLNLLLLVCATVWIVLEMRRNRRAFTSSQDLLATTMRLLRHHPTANASDTISGRLTAVHTSLMVEIAELKRKLAEKPG
jgi:hypothetical protein